VLVLVRLDCKFRAAPFERSEAPFDATAAPFL
jgi:hypothetical protein